MALCITRNPKMGEGILVDGIQIYLKKRKPGSEVTLIIIDDKRRKIDRIRSDGTIERTGK